MQARGAMDLVGAAGSTICLVHCLAGPILTNAGDTSSMASTKSVWPGVLRIGRAGKQSPTIAAASR